ncbi:MAG TPA: hypothetical protein VGB26_05125, partial [Nitrospiria bacterium]
AHRGSEWVNFVITRLSGGHLQAGESGNPGPSRHSRESGNPEDVDFKEPYRIPACRQAGPIKPFGNDELDFAGTSNTSKASTTE